MFFEVGNRYHAVERRRTCYFNGHHVAKIRTKKKGDRGRPFLRIHLKSSQLRSLRECAGLAYVEVEESVDVQFDLCSACRAVWIN